MPQPGRTVQCKFTGILLDSIGISLQCIEQFRSGVG